MTPPVEDTQPWYKQFWPWFLICLPGSVVVAGIVTIVIATQNPDNLVKSDYYKEGLAINESIGRQKKAATLGLNFTLTRMNKLVTLTSQSELQYPILYLFMQHPIEESKDFTIALNRQSDGSYLSNEPRIKAFNYRIRLYSPDKQWEILDRWHPFESPEKYIEAQ